jgi:membrane fusion protein, multidrug efflux system
VQELQGQRSVLVVGPDNTVRAQTIVTGDRVDQRWIVEQGLKVGDLVIVDGLQKVRPGARVTSRAFTESAAANGQ